MKEKELDRLADAIEKLTEELRRQREAAPLAIPVVPAYPLPAQPTRTDLPWPQPNLPEYIVTCLTAMQ